MNYLNFDIDSQKASLSIVIIGKNEEKNLVRVFASVLRASEAYSKIFKKTPEIIYIDSNSSDNSIDIAKKFNIPFKVIDGITTPAKAREKGFEETESEFIFFLDGDTVVENNWLIDGVSYLLENTNIGGVGGILKFYILKNDVIVWTNKNYRNTKKNGELIIDGVGGTFLYRRNSLKMIGGYHSNFRVCEEFELNLKLIAIGQNIVRITRPMAVHYDHKSINENFIRRYLFTKNIFVPGQIIRNATLNRFSIIIILKHYWLLILHLPVLLGSLLLFFFDLFFPAFLIIICLCVAHFYYKNWNLKRALMSMFSMNFYSFGFYFGFFSKHNFNKL